MCSRSSAWRIGASATCPRYEARFLKWVARGADAAGNWTIESCAVAALPELPDGVAILPDDIDRARKGARSAARGSVPAGIAAVTLASLLASLAISLLGINEKGARGDLFQAVMLGLIIAPVLASMAAFALGRAVRTSARDYAVERTLQMEAKRRGFEGRLTRALDMAATEPEVYDVTHDALVLVLPETPVEVLLADSSQAHLSRALEVGPDGHGPGCGVTTPRDCVAIRLSRAVQFDDSADLDACPRLKDRPGNPRCSAVCVPVSIAGRSVGVIHTTAPVETPLTRMRIAAVKAVASQLGARLSLIRLMTDTTLQATTDPLSGLVNRRSLEDHVRALESAGSALTVVMADLDQFKQLNDRHGHKAGDRAIRRFSDVLRSSVRAEDVVGRYGGEEFAIVLPDASIEVAVGIVERIEATLAAAVEGGEHPRFTASFGIAMPDGSEEFDSTLGRADAALLDAKRAGRDRYTVAA